MFKNYERVYGEGVQAANGNILPIKGRGTVALACGLVLDSCCHIPSVTKNLVSESYLTGPVRARITKWGPSAIIDKLPSSCRTSVIEVFKLAGLYVFSSIDGRLVSPVTPVVNRPDSSSPTTFTQDSKMVRPKERCTVHYTDTQIHSSVPLQIPSSERACIPPGDKYLEDSQESDHKSRFEDHSPVHACYACNHPYINGVALTTMNLKELHDALAHLSVPRLKSNLQEGVVQFPATNTGIFNNSHKFVCAICLRSKLTRPSHQGKLHVDRRVGAFFGVDVFGPMAVPSIRGNSYVFGIIEYLSKRTWLYFGKSKNVFLFTKDFLENEIVRLRSADNALGIITFVMDNGIGSVVLLIILLSQLRKMSSFSLC